MVTDGKCHSNNSRYYEKIIICLLDSGVYRILELAGGPVFWSSALLNSDVSNGHWSRIKNVFLLQTVIYDWRYATYLNKLLFGFEKTNCFQRSVHTLVYLKHKNYLKVRDPSEILGSVGRRDGLGAIIICSITGNGRSSAVITRPVCNIAVVYLFKFWTDEVRLH